MVYNDSVVGDSGILRMQYKEFVTAVAARPAAVATAVTDSVRK